MTGKIVAVSYILLGIQISFSLLPFPSLMRPLVESMPPDWIHWLMILFPRGCIIFGVVTLYKERTGFIALGVISLLFAGMYVWAIPYLIIWDYFPSLMPGLFELELFLGAILFGGLSGFLFFKSRTPNKQIN